MVTTNAWAVEAKNKKVTKAEAHIELKNDGIPPACKKAGRVWDAKTKTCSR
jgi:hypothetical protein